VLGTDTLANFMKLSEPYLPVTLMVILSSGLVLYYGSFAAWVLFTISAALFTVVMTLTNLSNQKKSERQKIFQGDSEVSITSNFVEK
jgi:large-conductance mechanosensitive channel